MAPNQQTSVTAAAKTRAAAAEETDSTRKLRPVTLAEVAQHSRRDDNWIVIDGHAYDVTRWAQRHPGGARVLSHYAGEDATDAFQAFHTELPRVHKYMRACAVGPVVDYKPSAIQEDFRQLRKQVEDLGLLKPSYMWFALQLAHILAFEVAGWAVLAYGQELLGLRGAFVLAGLLLTVVQAQAGWFQHDIGHSSLFHNHFWTSFGHRFVIGFIKGTSADWWNYRHFQHHSKTNALDKDPDIRNELFFMLGTERPVEYAKKKKGFMPYDWQHLYFHIMGPALLLPIYFHLETFYFLFRRGKRSLPDWAFIIAMWVKWTLMYAPLIGIGGSVALYFFVRFLESHWFTWVTQASHLPMPICTDKQQDWPTMHLGTTVNITPGAFNDWFTGHLNYQIEHHLFPTMPRHNYAAVKEITQSFCKKHGLKYVEKGLIESFTDIVHSLKKSGQLWRDSLALN